MLAAVSQMACDFTQSFIVLAIQTYAEQNQEDFSGRSARPLLANAMMFR